MSYRYIVLKNACVVDPLQEIDCEVMDICIDVESGRIVDCEVVKSSSSVKIIDVEGRLTMAGGIDIHAHVAGPKINIARLMRPEDHYKTNTPGVEYPRAHCGRSAQTVIRTGYRYAQMGYTLVCEAASPPLKTRHTHEELNDMPIVDKLTYILMDSTWLGLDYIVEQDYERLALYVAWLLKTVKGYTIKLVDPGADIAWFYGGGIGLDIDDQIPEYGVTPRDIIMAYCRVAQMLNLPHGVHIHTNRLGVPGNYTTLLETFRACEAASYKDRLTAHVTHIQFSGYKGDCWYTLESASEEIVRELEKSPHVSVDLGQVTFGNTTTMTADAPFEFILYHLGKWKAALHDIEAETAAGIVPYTYRERSYVNTIQWAIGLEVTLMCRRDTLWKIVLSTDHPNAGPFTRYPLIISWLMSKRAREEMFRKVNQRALRKLVLPSIDRELTFYEIAIITRAAPARILGLERERGTLRLGATADVAVYDIKPREFDPSTNPEEVRKKLSRAWLVLKSGNIVVREGKIVNETQGETLYVDVKLPEDLRKDIVKELKEKFKKYYSITYTSFRISEKEIARPRRVEVRDHIFLNRA